MGDADLQTGRHEVIVVDAGWDDAMEPSAGICLELTFTTGPHRGTVIPLVFRPEAAASALGLAPTLAGSPDLPVHVLGLPCTLVVAVDGDRVGYALEP